MRRQVGFGLLAWGSLLWLLLVWLAVVGQWVGQAPEEPPAASPRGGEQVWLGCTLTVVVLTDDVLATVEIENTSARPLQFFKHWLPPDGALLSEEFFIERGLLTVRYRCPVTKLVPLTPADYTTLQPGDKRTVTVPLRRCYDVMTPGSYSMRYRSSYVTPDTHDRVSLLCDDVNFERR